MEVEILDKCGGEVAGRRVFPMLKDETIAQAGPRAVSLDETWLGIEGDNLTR